MRKNKHLVEEYRYEIIDEPVNRIDFMKKFIETKDFKTTNINKIYLNNLSETDLIEKDKQLSAILKKYEELDNLIKVFNKFD